MTIYYMLPMYPSTASGGRLILRHFECCDMGSVTSDPMSAYLKFFHKDATKMAGGVLN